VARVPALAVLPVSAWSSRRQRRSRAVRRSRWSSWSLSERAATGLPAARSGRLATSRSPHARTVRSIPQSTLTPPKPSPAARAARARPRPSPQAALRAILLTRPAMKGQRPSPPVEPPRPGPGRWPDGRPRPDPVAVQPCPTVPRPVAVQSSSTVPRPVAVQPCPTVPRPVAVQPCPTVPRPRGSGQHLLLPHANGSLPPGRQPQQPGPILLKPHRLLRRAWRPGAAFSCTVGSTVRASGSSRCCPLPRGRGTVGHGWAATGRGTVVARQGSDRARPAGDSPHPSDDDGARPAVGGRTPLGATCFLGQCSIHLSEQPYLCAALRRKLITRSATRQTAASASAREDR
jgi:hypothetical protein